MNLELLRKHNFQFISFCPVFHANAITAGRINVNDDCHLLHITRGNGAIFIEGKKYRLNHGMVVAIPPFTRFYLKIAANFEMLNIHYRIKLADGDPLEDHAVLPPVFKPPYFDNILGILKKIRWLREKDLTESLHIAALAHEIIIRHLVSSELIDRARKIIDARLMNACRRMSSPDCTAFKAEEIARLCGLSVSQMNRLFRKCFRKTPHQFWEQRRFMELCRQLRATDLPASKIAAQFGMEDNAYFSRWFKKMAGCVPSEFRRRSI